MSFIGGLILLAIAMSMLFFARPKGDEPAAFLRERHWVVGQAYIMTTMILFVLGISSTIINWP
jgi:hypothetical protein